MKRPTRILTLALSLLMLLTTVSLSFTSCSETKSGGDTTTAATDVGDTTTAEEVKSKYDVGDNVPDTLKYNSEAITIISRSRDWVKDEVSVEDDDGGTISGAVMRRNKVVENRLGVVIDNTKIDGDQYAVSEIIRNQAKTGHQYDIFANSVYSTIRYTTENCFANLASLEYLDLSRPYWSQGFNEAASIGNKQYFCTGAIALSSYRFIFATFFNVDMFKDVPDTPDLYQTVNDHKWTIDYQIELSSKFWKDSDANGVTSEDDICGFVSNCDMIGVDSYWSAFKLPILTKDADNYLQYSLDIERTVNAVEKMQKLFWDTEGAIGIANKSSDGEQADIAKKFSENTAAMVTLRIIETEGEYLRSMSQTYGIVPMPMLDEEQDGYHSYAHDQMTAFGIANTTPYDRREMLGAFLEVMASESYRVVTPAYYEVALKSRYTKDPASWEMLDLITENLYIDPGVLYTKNISSVHQKFRDIVGDKLGGIATRFKQLERTVVNNCNALNEGLRSLTDD